MADDDDGPRYRFGLTLEIGQDDTLDIAFYGVARHHVPYMFSGVIADVITTTLMDMSLLPDGEIDAYEPGEEER